MHFPLVYANPLYIFFVIINCILITVLLSMYKTHHITERTSSSLRRTYLKQTSMEVLHLVWLIAGLFLGNFKILIISFVIWVLAYCCKRCFIIIFFVDKHELVHNQIKGITEASISLWKSSTSQGKITFAVLSFLIIWFLNPILTTFLVSQIGILLSLFCCIWIPGMRNWAFSAFLRTIHFSCKDSCINICFFVYADVEKQKVCQEKYKMCFK